MVHCRKGVCRGDGRALIQIEAAQNGRKKYFSTGVYVLIEHWDRWKSMVVGYPNADLLNAYLLERVIELEKVELELWKRGIVPTLEMLKEGIRKSDGPLMSFVAFAEAAIRDSVRCITTKKSLAGTLNCLSRYRSGYTWDEITHSFVHHFNLWLINEGYAWNTVVKHLRNLRTLINEAVLSGYIQYDDNPFRTFKVPQHKSKHKSLSPDELKRIEALEVPGHLAHSRDAFLFCCYTGLRYSDFCLLKEDNMYEDKSGKWLRIKLKKTGVEVAIPLSLLFNGKADAVLKRYNSVAQFAKVRCNSKINADLKILQNMSGIKTRLTFHVSRHTCATLLCYQGVPITTVQKILGHTKVATTQIYQEVMTDTIVNDLMRANSVTNP